MSNSNGQPLSSVVCCVSIPSESIYAILVFISTTKQLYII